MSMFLLRNIATNEIVGFSSVRENLENVSVYFNTSIEQTDENIISINGKFYKESEIPEPTQEEKLAALKEDYEKTVSEWLANFASTRGYEVSNMGAYAVSEHPIYSIEAKYFIQVQCDTWDACYVILNEALSGKREIPTKNELFELLPISKAQWPIENSTAEDAAQM